MVQILPQFDPGADIGKSFGGGVGDALKLLGQRQLGVQALEGLKGLDLENMTAGDIIAEVGKATVGLPQLARHSDKMVEALLREKRSGAAIEAQIKQAELREKGLPRGGVGEGVQPGAEGIAAGVSGAPGAGAGLESAGMRDMPLLGETTGREPLLSSEEISAITMPFIETGDTEGMAKALGDARGQAIKQRELQIQAQQARTQELTRRRELESELAQNVMARTNQLLKEKGLPPGEQWSRLAYKYFTDERNKPKNKNASDEALWNESGRRLERKIEDIAGAGDKFYRPTFRRDKERRAKGAQKWAQDHLGAFGTGTEERALLKSVMMDGGWSRQEATSIVQPFSPGLEKAFNAIPKFRAPIKDFVPGVVPPTQAEIASKWADKAVPSLVGSFQPSDSLLLLKDRLVRDKGLSDDQAIQVIDQMREGEQGLKLQDHQVAEEAFLPENTRPSLYDLFQGRKTHELLGPLIK